MKDKLYFAKLKTHYSLFFLKEISADFMGAKKVCFSYKKLEFESSKSWEKKIMKFF